MLQFVVEQRSVDGVGNYLDRMMLRIFQNMRGGMQEGMEGLAGEAVYQASAAGIQNRTGQLFTDILDSPKVTENAEIIRGRVSMQSEMLIGGRKFKGYLGTALDEGFHVPASKRPAKVFQFTSADSQTIFSRGHTAFDVKPHPFLMRAKNAYASTIFELIERRVAEAYA